MEVFKEEQRMTQWWLWFILFGISGIWIWAIVQQIGFGIPFGDQPASNEELLLSSIIPLGLILFFYQLKLKTSFDSKGIEIKYLPLANRFIKWNEIKKAELIEYGFVGYGLRFSAKYGTVYNVRGNIGLLLELQQGKVLIGTAKPDDIKQILEKYRAI